MGHSSSDAAVQVVQTLLRQEECVSVMGQKSKDVAVKGVQIMSFGEECVAGTGQRSNTNGAAAQVAKTGLRKEECVGDMGQIATYSTNLLHLDHNLNSLLQLKPYAIIELPELPSEDKKLVLFLGR